MPNSSFVYLDKEELHYRPTPHTFSTLGLFLVFTWCVHARSVQSPSLSLPFLCSIGMATLAQAHSYSFPILVIGRTQEAPAEALQHLDLFGHFRVFFFSAPLSHTRKWRQGPALKWRWGAVMGWVRFACVFVGQQRGGHGRLRLVIVSVFSLGKCVWRRSLSYLLILIVLTDCAGVGQDRALAVPTDTSPALCEYMRHLSSSMCIRGVWLPVSLCPAMLSALQTDLTASIAQCRSLHWCDKAAHMYSVNCVLLCACKPCWCLSIKTLQAVFRLFSLPLICHSKCCLHMLGLLGQCRLHMIISAHFY